MRKFKMPTTLLFELGRSTQFEVKAVVEFTYSPGHPGKLYGPPENCFPSEPAEVEVLKIIVHQDVADAGDELPWQMDKLLKADDELYHELCEYAEGQLADEHDAAMERRVER